MSDKKKEKSKRKSKEGKAAVDESAAPVADEAIVTTMPNANDEQEKKSNFQLIVFT